MPTRPNVLLVVADQFRADCVGADPAAPTGDDGDPLLHTPTLDSLVGQGTAFTRAYSPAPSCLPARRCLWSGRTPAGVDAFDGGEWTFEPTLPGELSRAGYQTRLVGRQHAIPHRNHFGFQHMETLAGVGEGNDDYARWLREQPDAGAEDLAHGIARNSWDTRTWHLDEQHHPTNWTTARAIDFLETRDPTRPFFLTVSYLAPHPPLVPPREYAERYADEPLDGPTVGDWSERTYGELARETPFPDTREWCADLAADRVRDARAAYYAMVTHLDHQLNRLLERMRIRGELRDTLVVVTSDHGEMLGDHYLWRKCYPFEGSARVPLLLRPPHGSDADRPTHAADPVGLEDVMPTVLDAAGIEVPAAVEGHSLFETLTGGGREYYHGEMPPDEAYRPADASHYLVGEERKYVYHPVTGEQRLFDLCGDPGETTDLAADPTYETAVREWRRRLASALEGRPVSDGTDLRTVEADGPW